MRTTLSGGFRFSHFPPAIWATAFATFAAFMGIGVVDPILPVIGRAMGATPAQVEWLFTSYIAVMAVAMLVSGVLATRLGGKRTLLAGLGIVVVFATASGLSPSIGVLALGRGGWGFGNALFTSTALSIIVGLSLGGQLPALGGRRDRAGRVGAHRSSFRIPRALLCGQFHAAVGDGGALGTGADADPRACAVGGLRLSGTRAAEPSSSSDPLPDRNHPPGQPSGIGDSVEPPSRNAAERPGLFGGPRAESWFPSRPGLLV